MNRRKPSITSLFAFFLITSPILYSLSYAPVVRLCGHMVDVPVETLTLPPRLSIGGLQLRMADGSAYPLYRPLDWLIDNTPLREPLFAWAGVWSVRDDFERGWEFRSRAGRFGRQPNDAQPQSPASMPDRLEL